MTRTNLHYVMCIMTQEKKLGKEVMKNISDAMDFYSYLEDLNNLHDQIEKLKKEKKSIYERILRKEEYKIYVETLNFKI